MPNKSYTVLSGSFRGPNNKLISLGGVIELPDDVAERFRHQLEVVAPNTPGERAGNAHKGVAKAAQDA